jgi:hypothetical protein
MRSCVRAEGPLGAHEVELSKNPSLEAVIIPHPLAQFRLALQRFVSMARKPRPSFRNLSVLVSFIESWLKVLNDGVPSFQPRRWPARASIS